MQSAVISIIGSGMWGIALAYAISQKSCVEMMLRDQNLVDEFNAYHTLKGIKLNDKVKIAAHTKPRTKYILVAVPSKEFINAYHSIKNDIDSDAVIIVATKGLDAVKKTFLSDSLQHKFCVLAGPNFAQQIIDGYIASTCVGSYDHDVATEVASIIGHEKLFVHTTHLVRQLEVGGALKNIAAIVMGFMQASKAGTNLLSAVIGVAAREISEISALHKESGSLLPDVIGDLVLTCSSNESRNFRYGEHLGLGLSINEWMGGTVEGLSSIQPMLSICLQVGYHSSITKCAQEIVTQSPSSINLSKLCSSMLT